MITLAINTASSKTAIALFGIGNSPKIKNNEVEKLMPKIDVAIGDQEKTWQSENDEVEKLMPEVNATLRGQGRDLIFEKTWQSKNDEAEKLMPEIDAALRANGLKFSDIDEVLVVRGPGSFTGLRIGVTVANTIAYLTGCRLHSVSTFDYWWTAAGIAPSTSSLLSNSTIAPSASSSLSNSIISPSTTAPSSLSPEALLIFAGKRGVYLSLPEKDVEIVNIDELQEKLKSIGINSVFGDISSEQKEKLGDIKFINSPETFGQICGKILTKDLSSEKIVVPLYVKNPGITKSKKNYFTPV